MTRIVRLARFGVAAALVSLTTLPAGAQQAAGNWQGWLGCWSAGAQIGGIAPSALAPVVCIAPTSDPNVVDVATIGGEKVISTQRIDASGRETPVETKGCTGTQRAQWSADGRRVYLNAVTTCDGVQRSTSGIIAMSSTGEWLDVQGVAAGGEEGVRVARYRDVGVTSAVPAAIAAAIRERATATTGARFLLGGTVGSNAVIEASHSATPAVVEAWLLERGQQFGLDAKELVRLADAGVPARVTDAMVAVSNPDRFAVARPDGSAGSPRALHAEDELLGRRIYVVMDPVYSPYRWGYTPYGYGYGYGYGFGAYGYSPLYGGGYGYGSGYYGYPGYVAPIVVLNPQQPQARGQAVRGRGYTQRDPDPSASTPSSARSGDNSSSSSSGSSSSGSSSQPRSEPAPRTAHPKP